MGILAINSDPLKLWGENYDPSANDSSANDSSTNDPSTNVDPNPQDPSTNDSSARFVITPSTVEFTDSNLDQLIALTYTFDGNTIDPLEAENGNDGYLMCNTGDTEMFSAGDITGISCYYALHSTMETLTATDIIEYLYYPGGDPGGNWNAEHYSAQVTVTINNVTNPYYSSGEGE